MADSAEMEGFGDTVLRIRLFGPASFTIAARDLRFKSLKLRAALGYIALSESQTETRERLVGLLWSESGEDHARASLRQNIRELRVAIQGTGFTRLYIAGHEIGFEPGSIEVDVTTVIAAAEAGRVHPLLLERRNLADELLAGLEDLDPSFRSWVLAKRQTVRDRLLRALEIALANETTDLATQGNLAQAILNLDATHEDAARRLMRARAMLGDTAGALRVYSALWDLLDEDYGMEPAEATQKLVADIKIGALEPPPAPNPTDTAAPLVVPEDILQPWTQQARLSLFVQTVTLREVDPGKSHLVLEFRQHLIGSLIQFREWQVADAPAQLHDAQAAPGTAGRYDVSMIAYQSGEAVNMMITLRDLDTGLYVWTQNFELKLENWFVVQRQVVRRIATGLNVYLSAERLRRFSDQPAISLGIYDRWLRCQVLVRTFDPRYWNTLMQQYTAITVEAPDFGPAYTGLADLYNSEHIFHPGVFRSTEGERTALTYARKAVQADPADASPHRCLAWSHLMARQYDQALMHMDVASELNPNDSWTLVSSALMKAFCGQPDRAAELARMALDMTLAPSRPHWIYQSQIQYLNGDYQAAINASDHAGNVIWPVPAWRAAALAQLGRVQEATALVSETIAQIRANWFGSASPSDAAIIKWMLYAFSFTHRRAWEHLRDGWAKASLPVEAIDYDDMEPPRQV
jgi:DNA-binding SARP family transcriptional activator